MNLGMEFLEFFISLSGVNGKEKINKFKKK